MWEPEHVFYTTSLALSLYFHFRYRCVVFKPPLKEISAESCLRGSIFFEISAKSCSRGYIFRNLNQILFAGFYFKKKYVKNFGRLRRTFFDRFRLTGGQNPDFFARTVFRGVIFFLKISTNVSRGLNFLKISTNVFRGVLFLKSRTNLVARGSNDGGF